MDDSKSPCNALETPVYLFSLPIINLDVRFAKVGIITKISKIKKQQSPPKKKHSGVRVETTVVFLFLGQEKLVKKLSKIERLKRHRMTHKYTLYFGSDFKSKFIKSHRNNFFEKWHYFK